MNVGWLGETRFKGKSFKLSAALEEHEVALCAHLRWLLNDVYFVHHRLGGIDLCAA